MPQTTVKKKRADELRDRNQQIVYEIEHGMNYENAGKLFNMSRQRVQQIVKSQGVSIRTLKQKYPHNYYKTIEVACRCGCGKTVTLRNTVQNRRRTFIDQWHYKKYMREHFPHFLKKGV